MRMFREKTRRSKVIIDTEALTLVRRGGAVAINVADTKGRMNEIYLTEDDIAAIVQASSEA